jgi:ankyrin repeat protein
MQAVEEGDTERVKELIDLGVDVNAPNDDKEDKLGQTALHKAVQFGREEIGEILLEAGGNTRWTDQGFREPWYYAAFSASAPTGQHARMTRLLFRYEKRPTSDLLLLASFSSQPGVMSAMLDELGREVLSRDSNDWCKFRFSELHLLDDDHYQCVWPDGSKTSRGQTAFGTLVEKSKKQLLTHPSVQALMRSVTALCYLIAHL